MIDRDISPSLGMMRRVVGVTTVGIAGGLAAIGCGGGGGPEMATAPAGIELNALDAGNGNNVDNNTQTPSNTEGVSDSGVTTTETPAAPSETNVITDIRDLGTLAGCISVEMAPVSPQAEDLGITQIGVCATGSSGELVTLTLVELEDPKSVQGFLDFSETEACDQPEPMGISYAAGKTWIAEAEAVDGPNLDAADLSLAPLVESTPGARFVALEPNC